MPNADHHDSRYRDYYDPEKADRRELVFVPPHPVESKRRGSRFRKLKEELVDIKSRLDREVNMTDAEALHLHDLICGLYRSIMRHVDERDLRP